MKESRMQRDLYYFAVANSVADSIDASIYAPARNQCYYAITHGTDDGVYMYLYRGVQAISHSAHDSAVCLEVNRVIS